ncbi:hypothetical protein TNIN_380561 [Trichonephila inaurata madagascariensis]|uniref:Uncharacterized protein n=1 Tax=Trichonephila inaurata madagascariensis TaxID=2747483 RepID=A0A8X6IWE4_9ARAC|nr:hypothetical protein TNIN_380561 [Trichonephila inaurata madagascariensis]
MLNQFWRSLWALWQANVTFKRSCSRLWSNSWTHSISHFPNKVHVVYNMSYLTVTGIFIRPITDRNYEKPWDEKLLLPSYLVICRNFVPSLKKHETDYCKIS